jgi:hypothetical protein
MPFGKARGAFPGDDSLPRLLAWHFGARNRRFAPPLSVNQILTWVAKHHERTGRWPSGQSGPVEGVPGETWCAIDMARQQSGRGLDEKTTLAQFIARHFGIDRRQPRLSVKKVLALADAHYRRHKRWPGSISGPVDGMRVTWAAIDSALRDGRYGLRGGTTLARLLASKRDYRSKRIAPPLTVAQILDWAKAHRAATGKWPTADSGPVRGVKGEHWTAIDGSLRHGFRDLPGGSSLSKLVRPLKTVHRSEASEGSG